MSVVDILSTVVGRRQFVLFLEPLQANGLIGFYSAVEELKFAGKASYHQLGSEIFYTYIRAPASPVIVDKVFTSYIGFLFILFFYYYLYYDIYAEDLEFYVDFCYVVI